jgi:hypothetical protein
VSIGAGKAAGILGVSPTDIQRVTRTSQVTFDSCDARIAELAAQRFEEQDALRYERRERWRRDAALIASGALRVGQPVLAYYDRRAAVVTKINRVSITVKHVGGQSDHYGLVDRN